MTGTDGADAESLASAIVTAARRAGITIATAESCTGGLVAAALTDIAGASDAFDRGFVTYSNAAKTEMLGVPAEMITRNGAVSEAVAEAMARGARAASGAALAVAITGIAGPGGSEHKPEGRVCFAVSDASGRRALTVEFGPLGRARVRMAATRRALVLLLEAIGGA